MVLNDDWFKVQLINTFKRGSNKKFEEEVKSRENLKFINVKLEYSGPPLGPKNSGHC